MQARVMAVVVAKLLYAHEGIMRSRESPESN